MKVQTFHFLDYIYRLSNKVSFWIKPRKLQKRVDTYPLLSSDGYAMHCQTSIGRDLDIDSLQGVIAGLREGSSFYVPGRFVNQLSEILPQKPVTLKSLVIGDDDITPDPAVLELLRSRIEIISSVNLINISEGVRAIPLGLESPSYRSGGKLSDFRKPPKQVSKLRKFNFLVSWNQETNPLKRLEAMEAFEQVKNSLIFKKRITSQTVHNLMRKTLFVPCPRGNGLDTHRIWEALYLGAIPVVLNSDRFAALEGWPILFIEEWKEIIEKSREELEAAYDALKIPYGELLNKSIEIYQGIT